MHKILPLALLLPLIAACTSPLEHKAERARSEMIGLSADQLMACAGQPTARNREGGADIWSYFRETSRSATIQTEQGFSPAGRGEVMGDYFRYCEATFILQNGKISALEFRGRTATGREILEPCGAIVDRCLPNK
jgi:hypothetical protein